MKGKLFKNIKVFKIILIFIVAALLIICLQNKNKISVFLNFGNMGLYNDAEIKSEVERIYNERSKLFVEGDIKSLKSNFDTSQKYGVWSYEHEIKRIKYLSNWAKERNIKFTNVESSVRIKKIHTVGTKVRIYLEETYKFDYVYNSDTPRVNNSFGVGIRHTLNLIKKDNKYFVYNDWYTDCFEDALASYTADVERDSSAIYPNPYIEIYSSLNKSYIVKYDRERAVEYADKYCGAAWGSGNDFKYNKKYRDFNGIGGDCTNYASQVLGDKEGGGIQFDGTWYCRYSKYGDSQGSTAWVNADAFKNYLIYSGKGRLIKRGDYKKLTELPIDNPDSPISKLKLGDLICYEKKGNIDHFAVVTGFDNKGYPLINSHTTDRYHVPWDLGWGDKKIKFLFIHING